MSDSVGKISLDLDLKADLSKQINNIASRLGSDLTRSLKNTMNTATKGLNLTNLSKGMSNALKSATEDSMKGLTSGIESTLESMEKRLLKSISVTDGAMKKTINENKKLAETALDSVSERLGKLKKPLIFDKLLPKTPSAETVMPSIMPQGSSVLPKRTVKPPEVNMGSTKAEIDSLVPVLDNVNAKLDFQRRKLEDLKKSYDGTYNVDRKNKLESQILNTESAILRLTKTSDSTAQKIWVLEDALKGTSQATAETLEPVKQLDSNLKRTNNTMNESNNSMKRTEQAARKTGNAFFFMGNRANTMGSSIQRAFTRILKQVVVFAVLYKAIRGFTSYVGSALQTNDQFMHSLNQVRTNLQVAFMPIYQAILPALNAMMKALATVTAYIASFVNAIFGKTYKQSFRAAKGLNAARSAMAGFGGASKKAAKEAKKAKKELRDLAGFDEINTLADNSDSPDVGGVGDPGGGGGSGGAGGIAPLVMPDLDTSVLDAKMKALLDKVKKFLAPTTDALKRLWKAMDPFKAFVAKGAVDFFNNFLKPVGKWVFGEGIPRFLDALGAGFQAVNWIRINDGLNGLWKVLTPFTINVGEGLLWFWEKVLVPLGAWTISNVVPVFLDILSAAIRVVNNTLEALAPLAVWLFDSFLKPLAAWTGGTIVKVLGWIGDALLVIGDWIQDNQKWVESIAVVILSFAAAWKIVTAALAAWTAVTKIATLVTGAFNAAILFLTSPIGIAIAIIGGLIAVGILLWKNWDEVSAFLKKLWTGLKNSATSIFGATGKFLTETTEEIRTSLTNGFTRARDSVVGTVTNLKKKATDTFVAMGTGVAKTVTNLRTKATGTFTAMRTGITNVVTGIRTSVSKSFVNTRDSVVKTITGLRTSASNIFGAIRTALSKIATNIRTNITGTFSGLRDGVLGAFRGIQSKMSGIWSGIWNTIKGFINRIIGGMNGMIRGMNKLSFKAPDWVPGMGGKSFGINIPNIPKLAKGGIIDQPTVAMVGEAGKEAVMPLENNTGWITNLAGQIAGQMGPQQSGGNEHLLQKVIDILLKILDALLNNDSETVLKLGETEFGRATIKAINNTQRQAGKTLLEI